MDEFLFFQYDHCHNHNDCHHCPQNQCILTENVIFSPPNRSTVQCRQTVNHKITLDIRTDKKYQSSCQQDPVHVRMNQQGNQVYHKKNYKAHRKHSKCCEKQCGEIKPEFRNIRAVQIHRCIQKNQKADCQGYEYPRQQLSARYFFPNAIFTHTYSPCYTVF